MAVFSNSQIVEARTSGQIVIEPFVMANVRKSSYDLTLGEFFYRGSSEQGGIYNPFDEADVRRNYIGPFQAKPYFNVWRKLIETDKMYPPMPVGQWWPLPDHPDAKAVFERYLSGDHPARVVENYLPIGLVGIPADHPIIMLLPGEFILAHTHEFAGIHPPGTTEMRARSSIGRQRISVCLCAGWGDPGYINRWTMEIHNLSPKAIPLPVGERVAQLIFHETGDVYGGQYGAENGYRSKYQDATDISEVIAAWRPQNMLPRSYMDERKLPAQIGYAGAATSTH